jgi:GH24 family phage-related lysozyme (muramidase)
MAEGGLPIPETGKILQGPGVIDGDQYSNARAWGQIAAAGERLQDVSAKAAHQLVVGAVADQELEIRRKQLELHDQFHDNPEGFDAAWKGYTDGKLTEAQPWMVDQLRRKLGSEGNAAYGAILGTRRADDMRKAGESQSALVTQTASDVVGSAMAGNMATPDGVMKIAKYRAVLDAGVTADLHTKEWSDLHFDDTMSKASGEVAAQQGVKVYHEEGFEAAVAHLRKNILENENLTLKGEGRYRAFSRGLQAIRLEQQADKADRTEIIQSSTDLRARINSRQQYDDAEVRDTLGALQRSGAASEYAKLSKDHAVAQAAAPLYAGMRPAEGAQLVAGMRVSVAQGSGLAEAVKRFEGFTPTAKWDYKQFSGGYGTRAIAGETIDRATADQRLNKELGEAASIVDKVNPNLPAGARDAMISLTFNSGSQWVNAELGNRIRSGDLAGAKERFVEYNKAGDKVEPGLVSRRAQEVQWFDRPEGAGPAAPGTEPSPFAGEVTKRVQALWITDQKKAWPAFKAKIDQGQVLDEDDFAAIRYASALSNDPHWAKEVDVLYRANKVGLVAKTEGWSESARNDVLNELRAKSVAEGWGVEEGPLLDSLEKQFVRQNKMVREDPVRFHVESGGVPPPPLNVASSPDFRAGLMARSRISSTVAKDQGIPPGSALAEAELPSVKAALDAADPAGKARIFADMAVGIPDEKVLAATMHKLGADAPHAMVQVFAGMIQRQDPRVAQSILRGQQAIKADKRNDPLQEGEKKDVFNAALDAALPEGAFSLAGRTNPLGSYATMRNATIARYADLTAQDPNSKHEFSEERLKQAANDVTGGVLRFNGGNLIAPKRGMTQDNFDGVMYGLTDTDLAGVGTPGGQIITADYMRQNGHLEAVGEGLYLVKFGAEGPNKTPTYAQKFDVSGESSPFLLDLKDRESKPIARNLVGFSPAGLAAAGVTSLYRSARDWWQQGGATAVEDGVKKMSEDARPAWDYFANIGTDIANAISTEAEAAPKLPRGPGGAIVRGLRTWTPEGDALYRSLVKQGAKTEDIIEKTGMAEGVVRNRMVRRELAMASMFSDAEESKLVSMFQERQRKDGRPTEVTQDALIKYTESLTPRDLDLVTSSNNMSAPAYSMFMKGMARQVNIDHGEKGESLLRTLHPEVFDLIGKDRTGLPSKSAWTPMEDAALAKWVTSDALTIPPELAHRSETSLMQRAREQGFIERRPPAGGRQPGPPKETPEEAVKPGGSNFMELAHEPRQALLLIERAADSGSTQAKMLLNQLIGAPAAKRDELLQGYIDRLKKAGWSAPVRNKLTSEDETILEKLGIKRPPK